MAKILVIDDRKTAFLHSLKEFAGKDYEISSTANIGAVRDDMAQNRPDLVILNLLLNGAYGWDVFFDIKVTAPCIPVIITSSDDKSMYDRRFSMADESLIGEFFSLEELTEKINTVISQSARKNCHETGGFLYAV